MQESLWPEIIVALLSGGLAGLFSIYCVRKEFIKARSLKLIDKKLDVYENCTRILERNISDSKCVFKKQFMEDLRAIKCEIKLYASSSVVQSFERYYKWAHGLYCDFRNVCNQADVTDRRHLEYTEDGEEYEECDFTEDDLKYQDFITNNYIEKKDIPYDTVKSKTQEVLNAMRADLGNDSYHSISVS